MNPHQCVLCMGSNIHRLAHLASAREALVRLFPDIRFGRMMETEAIGTRFLSPFSNQMAVFTTPWSAEEVHARLKTLEHTEGRRPDDKARGIVVLDADLLQYDEEVLKPEDFERAYIREGMKEFF